MELIEIIIVAAAATVVIGVLISSIIKKRKGKNYCCNCSSCPYHIDCEKKNDN